MTRNSSIDKYYSRAAAEAKRHQMRASRAEADLLGKKSRLYKRTCGKLELLSRFRAWLLEQGAITMITPGEDEAYNHGPAFTLGRFRTSLLGRKTTLSISRTLIKGWSYGEAWMVNYAIQVDSIEGMELLDRISTKQILQRFAEAAYREGLPKPEISLSWY